MHVGKSDVLSVLSGYKFVRCHPACGCTCMNAHGACWQTQSLSQMSSSLFKGANVLPSTACYSSLRVYQEEFSSAAGNPPPLPLCSATGVAREWEQQPSPLQCFCRSEMQALHLGVHTTAALKLAVKQR